jgi:hypothetical protein
MNKDKTEKEKSADNKRNKKSLVAPVSDSKNQENLAINSAIDKVLLVDVTNAVAMKRAMGRRLDPVTGKMYHLEFNPPPFDQPVESEFFFWDTTLKLVPFSLIGNN